MASEEKKNLCIIINTNIGTYPAYCVTTWQWLKCPLSGNFGTQKQLTDTWPLIPAAWCMFQILPPVSLLNTKFIWLTSEWYKIVLSVFSIRSPTNFEGFFVMCYKNARALSTEPPCRKVDLAGKSKKHNESKKRNYQTYKKIYIFYFFFLPLKSVLFVFTFEKVTYISSACRKQTNKHTTMHKTTPNVKASASKSSLDIWIVSLYSVCSISNKTL